MNIRPYALIIAVLLVSILFSPFLEAKHIIVIYDVSGSMVSLRIDGRVNRYMESEDIHRVNDYLTNLLFTDTSQSLRDIDDSYIKECNAVYVGKPLYQSGDILTYANYADRRYEKIRRAQVRRNEFQPKLPNPTNLANSFHGQVSYLLRAEVDVYDALYSEADNETYWVFVTDGDIDNSGKSDPGISAVLKRLAEIEGEYYTPMIFGILVNNHVRIQIRRLQKRSDIESIFIGTPTKPKEPVRKIQLSRNAKGQFISETLTVDTENAAKSKFKLNSVNVEVVDEYNRPLQVVNKDNTVGILVVTPISLHGNPPPYEFRIAFPAKPEIAAPGNALKLEVTYSYNGVDKDPYSAPPMNCTAVIDSVYVANPEDPDRQTKQLDLHFSEGIYRGDLIVQSESPNKEAFQIKDIRCQIQYKDGRKLCDAAVVPAQVELNKPFRVEVLEAERLDWYGNKLVLHIDYQYEGNAKSATLGTLFKLRGGSNRFPIWLLIVPLLILCGAGAYFLIRWVLGLINPPRVEYQIKLTQINAAGILLADSEKVFTLTDKDLLAFEQGGNPELLFDVGCPDVLRCDKNSPWPWSQHKGQILHCKTIDDAEGQILAPPETLTLKRDGADAIHIHCEIVDEPSVDKPDEEPTLGPVPPVDPLKV